MIQVDRRTYSARSENFSFGDATLLLDSIYQPSIGDDIRVMWKGAWMNATVRNVTDPDGSARIGIEWHIASRNQALSS